MRKKPTPQTIPSQVIRDTLIERARAFVETKKSSFSAIGLGAVNDSKILSRVANGENFSVKTYQRVIDWMDAQEASERETAA